MHKLLALAAFGCLAMMVATSPTTAQNTPALPAVAPFGSVSDILSDPRDNHPAYLTGRLTQTLGDERYIFTDDTGSIRMEIDDELFKGLGAIDAETRLRVLGEVDVDGRNDIEVDADKVMVVD